MAAEPWRRAETPGPVRALVITRPGDVLAAMKKAKNPILVVGSEVVKIDLGNGKKPIDYVLRIAKATKIPVITTAQMIGEFLKRDFQPTAWMSAMDIGNRLTDPNWSVSGQGKSHDLALFIGIPYTMDWLIQSGLKSFAPHIKTMSLDRFYEPNANWSFANLSLEEWHETLEAIALGVERK